MVSQLPALPTWTAGEIVDADDMNELNDAITPFLQVFKPVSTTRASTTTFSLDPDLQTILGANSVYLIEMGLRPAALTAALFKTTWHVPSGSAGNREVQGPGSSATDTNADNMSMRSGVHGFATSVTYGSRNSASNEVAVREVGIVTTGSTSDVCGLLWAQATSNATGSVLGAGSWMRVSQLA